MSQFKVVSYPTAAALAAAAAAAWLDAVAAARMAGRGFTVAVSGGRVLRRFLAESARLAAQYHVDFSHVRFFWADERCVPPDDPASNFRLAHEAFLHPAHIPNTNIHRVRGEDTPGLAAEAASRDMRQVCGTPAGELPVLDLIMLGMGEDGHVASLFPRDATTAAAVTAVFLPVADAPKPPPMRVTLGHGPLAAARTVWVLASGSGKQAALRHSLATGGTTPLASVIQHRAATTIWTDIAWE
ncbi:MAG: 6-phosphogluconolactonase [Verrucomicrobiota bacterium]